METFLARGKSFPLTRTYVMGILNVTPDSFSDGGRYLDPAAALARAREMEGEGADILDVGGQSTRPGHTPVSPEEEWARLKEVLPALLAGTKLAVSVDTFYPQVAVKALEAGAHIINDVSGFGEEMLAAVAGSGCGCVVMFPGGGEGRGVAGAARAFFSHRREAAARYGIGLEHLCFDPGVGFGTTYEEDLALIAQVGAARLPGSACLMAASRKRVTGRAGGGEAGPLPVEDRLAPTLAAHTAAALGGADILRAHDVKETVWAARMADALKAHRG